MPLIWPNRIAVMILVGQLATLALASSNSRECDGPDAISLSCGHYFLNVEGWAEYSVADGTVHPVHRLRVFSGYYHDGAFDGDLQKVKAKTKRTGFFTFMAAVPHSTHEGCMDGKPYRNEIYLKEHYLLRAKGCDDLVLEVTKDWSPRHVQMHCPNKK